MDGSSRQYLMELIVDTHLRAWHLYYLVSILILPANSPIHARRTVQLLVVRIFYKYQRANSQKYLVAYRSTLHTWHVLAPRHRQQSADQGESFLQPILHSLRLHRISPLRACILLMNPSSSPVHFLDLRLLLIHKAKCLVVRSQILTLSSDQILLVLPPLEKDW